MEDVVQSQMVSLCFLVRMIRNSDPTGLDRSDYVFNVHRLSLFD
jgi:hypothetical protein